MSQRCRLRFFSEKDLMAFAQYRAAPSVARFQSWSSYSLDDAKKLFATLNTTDFGETGSWFQIAIADKQDDRLLGDCALHFLADDQQVEIGFTLAPEHQGKGLAKEAVAMLLDYVFMEMAKHRVIAITDAENHRAKKIVAGSWIQAGSTLQEKCFFQRQMV